MQLVSSAENSSLDWKSQYGYIEDIHDGRGYTGGIIGFTSGTGDMLELVQNYTRSQPDNGLAKYLPALVRVNGSDSVAGLGDFVRAWRAEAGVVAFQKAQDDLRDDWYFDPAVQQGRFGPAEHPGTVHLLRRDGDARPGRGSGQLRRHPQRGA